mmetsp:Transcript_1448/g.3010  ORF Transcript_1448/g.3010 Transcript_1448/m.3010 type:complete len:201 (+) Transcript_1448:377-979(+)
MAEIDQPPSYFFFFPLVFSSPPFPFSISLGLSGERENDKRGACLREKVVTLSCSLCALHSTDVCMHVHVTLEEVVLAFFSSLLFFILSSLHPPYFNDGRVCIRQCLLDSASVRTNEVFLFFTSPSLLSFPASPTSVSSSFYVPSLLACLFVGLNARERFSPLNRREGKEGEVCWTRQTIQKEERKVSIDLHHRASEEFVL